MKRRHVGRGWTPSYSNDQPCTMAREIGAHDNVYTVMGA